MSELFARKILLPTGWADNARLTLDGNGSIKTITTDTIPGAAEQLPGPVVPGMVNGHSHAFQRMIAGLTDIAHHPDDSFWTWREAMYRAALRLAPEDMEAVCRQVYIEMLRAGYTTVAEFHYVHHQPDGEPYQQRAELALRALAAAAEVGIGICLLPVLYCYGSFGGQPPSPGQRRFINDLDGYLTLHQQAAEAVRAQPRASTGVAFHSLRAVTAEQMTNTLAALPAQQPIHIHVAEQQPEVDDCLAWSGRRPVDWLLTQAPVDEHWCLIHATHVDDGELASLAERRPTIGLCPTTEANLGDGLARAEAFNDRAIPFAIGSDSHVSLSVVEELRWLEYGQRLVSGRRNRLASAATPAVGQHLYSQAAEAGARATGQAVGRLEPGRRADLVVLDDRDPLLADCSPEHLLNRWLFGAGERAIREVWVAGERLVADGQHPAGDQAAAAFGDVCRQVLYD